LCEDWEQYRNLKDQQHDAEIPSDKFIENLVSKILGLTHHHYTAKQQARYLKEAKENLVRPVHNFGRLLRELLIYTPRCYTGFSSGKQPTNSLSFHFL
jgi:hypothetical protein